MQLRRYFVEGLAHASYLVGADDEAAVVDPKRDVDDYLAEATPEAKMRLIREEQAREIDALKQKDASINVLSQRLTALEQQVRTANSARFDSLARK